MRWSRYVSAATLCAWNSEVHFDPVPAWGPASGHALRHAGIHFDAVRVIGLLCEQIAYEIMQFTDFQAGPIVRSGIGERSMFFLLPPQTVAA
ncbi:hypothetical protein [Streptomyces fulvorobeus]|uniref:Uncharacterized protein n=1 Tax=Streptomyces fulvorobeus TaxID=284028 RepID=A0A7Y9HDI7_9ACTN|nr:hypothetical protein [Streptomyces fulvorobeus]NYE42256.1 hypothetical protein [Streptomyces fulvorobeus]